MVPTAIGDVGRHGERVGVMIAIGDLQGGMAAVDEDEIAKWAVVALVYDVASVLGIRGADPKLDGEVVFAHVDAWCGGWDLDVLVLAVELEGRAHHARNALRAM